LNWWVDLPTGHKKSHLVTPGHKIKITKSDLGVELGTCSQIELYVKICPQGT